MKICTIKSAGKPLFFLKQISDGGVFLFGNHSDFNACQSSLGFAILSLSYSSKYFFLCLIILWTSFLTWENDVSYFLPQLRLYFQSMLRWLDLIFLIKLLLMRNFSTIILRTIHCLYFFMLAVFKDAILLTTSVNFCKTLNALFPLWYLSSLGNITLPRIFSCTSTEYFLNDPKEICWWSSIFSWIVFPVQKGTLW